MKKPLIVMVALVLLAPAGEKPAQFDREWEIYLIHHTHVDIGYTHTQDEVMRIQWQNMELALDLIEETRSFPDDARFRWNPEALWAVTPWFEQASAEDRARFVKAVQEGSLGLDAMFGNLLTGLSRPEELWQALAMKREFEILTGVPITSVMTTDVPGATWGLVAALSGHGVRYLSMGPNRNHRIGHTLKDWGDQPFYWVSPSGRQKVLCFVHGKGYSWFHTGLNMKQRVNLFTPRRVFPYLKDLEKSGYPYSLIPVRYSIGADNGPPDPAISRVVKEWNEKHPRVRVRLSTTAETLAEFERRYGDQLPEFAGDFTGYWEDGAASTARETAIARNASEKLDQVQTLWALLGHERPADRFRRAWTQVLLFNEHTWGAWNSITMPDSRFAKQQWEWKRNRALEAADLADRLFNELTAGLSGPEGAEGTIYLEVFNTHSWPVTGPVTIGPEGLPGARVETLDGKPIPSQVLSDGSLFFIAREIPPLSSKKFAVKSGGPASGGSCTAGLHSLTNEKIEIVLDPLDGTILSLRNLESGRELVNHEFKDKFNQYVYVFGRLPRIGRLFQALPKTSIRVLEPGPLLCRVELTRQAMRSNSLVTTITVFDGLSRIDLENRLDRPRVRFPEGVHFAFPVKADPPAVRYDTAWGVVELDRDQLSGACKNYITPLRWVEVSGETGGLMFTLIDAPLFEAGEIAADAAYFGWLRATKPNGVIYSYVMNNYWETNYKADQPGLTAFRYSLFPRRGFDEAANSRDSLEVMQPLLAVMSSKEFASPPPPLLSDHPDIILESLEPLPGGGLLIRLYNLSGREQTARLSPGEPCQSMTLFESGRERSRLEKPVLDFGRHEFRTVVCGK